MTSSALSSQSTVGEWLDDPAGAAIFDEILSQAGASRTSLEPVRSLPLAQLVPMSGGLITNETVAGIVQRVGGVESTVDAAASTTGAVEAAAWVERITPDRVGPTS
jgi:hypothetical protein